MEKLWKRLEQYLENNCPILLHSLSQGASDESIDWLEKEIDCSLPQAMKKSLKLHNGQKTDEFGGLFWGFTLLSVESIYEEWTIWTDLSKSGAFNDFQLLANDAYEERVKQDLWWRVKWIPFTSDGGGNHLCIDTEPTEYGQEGQIIEMWHDTEKRPVVADSYEELFRHFVEALETDSCRFRTEYEYAVFEEE
ncbi:MAG: SMI1/KNR4 family protein [Bacilli bacterium]